MHRELAEILKEALEAGLQEARLRERLMRALQNISHMPCLTALLGDCAENSEGCGCASCQASSAIEEAARAAP